MIAYDIFVSNWGFGFIDIHTMQFIHKFSCINFLFLTPGLHDITHHQTLSHDPQHWREQRKGQTPPDVGSTDRWKLYLKHERGKQQI